MMDDKLHARLREVELVFFDFDGVFTDNRVHVSEDGVESVSCWRGDGFGIRRLQKLGLNLIVLSTEVNPVVKTRCLKLKLECMHGIDDKLSALQKIIEDKGLTAERVAYVGNDINDTQCLQHVGLPIVVADAHADVLELGLYRTELPGGYGAVREVCDLIASAQESGA